MNDAKIIEKIIELMNKIDYKKAYIEIETYEDKFTIEKYKKNPIGFRN